MQDLGTLQSLYTRAHTVSYDGSVVVGDSFVAADQSSGSYSHAFRWENGTIQDLGTFGGNSNAVALSRDGSVIVGLGDDGRGKVRAIRWENGTMQVLDTLEGGEEAIAVDVSDDGLVVAGSSSTALSFTRAVRWTAQIRPPVDDGDGIAAEIDGRYSSGVFSDESGVFSDHFTDQHLDHLGVPGKTFGKFGTRGGLTVTITDTPGNGVEANVTGGGTGEATIQACSNSADYTVNMTTPTRALIQCGSLSLQVLEGVASVTLGNGAEVAVPVGASAKMDKLDGSYSVENLSTTSDAAITVKVGNTTTQLSLGETKAASYSFTGFFQPIDMNGVLNVAKAGSVIPVKFSLGGDQGLNIFVEGFPKALLVSCPTSSVLDTIEQVSTTSGLKYDAVTGQYNYAWKTGSWAGTCRRLQVKLVDGKTYTANFKFTK